MEATTNKEGFCMEIVNTVSAKNQVARGEELNHLGNENAPVKILVVGNSITLHAPKPEIGWHYSWGMAASAEEKDYVHVLFSKLKAAGKDVFMRVHQMAYWERNFLTENIEALYAEDHAFDPDILVFRLGENVPDAAIPHFKAAMERLIHYICPNGKVVYTTTFFKNHPLDAAIRETAKARGENVAEIGYETRDWMAIGLFEHDGVQIHPGDLGMQVIADRIYEQMIPLL